jgi:hypothetical protein
MPVGFSTDGIIYAALLPSNLQQSATSLGPDTAVSSYQVPVPMKLDTLTGVWNWLT